MPGNPQNSNSELCECDLAKVVHSRARPPCFSSVFVRLFTAHCPASFFRAGIAILARKVTLEFCAILEMTQTARDLLLARPRGASSRGPASIFLFPLFSLSHKDQTGPRSTCRPRPTHPNASTSGPSVNVSGPPITLRMRGQEANPVLLCLVMYWPRPPDSTWSSPHQ